MKGDKLMNGLIIVLLLTVLTHPIQAVKNQAIGQVYVENNFATNIYLKPTSELKKAKIYNISEFLDTNLRNLSLIGLDYLESNKSFWQDLLQGKAAVISDKNAKLGLICQTFSELPKGNSLVWKYVNYKDLVASFWVGNYEVLFLKKPQKDLVRKIKQNEKVTTAIDSQTDMDLNAGFNMISTLKEQIAIVSSEEGTMIRVVRDDQKGDEIFDLLRDSFSSLDDFS